MAWPSVTHVRGSHAVIHVCSHPTANVLVWVVSTKANIAELHAASRRQHEKRGKDRHPDPASPEQ